MVRSEDPCKVCNLAQAVGSECRIEADSIEYAVSRLGSVRGGEERLAWGRLPVARPNMP